jgi:hypothetical protein
MDGWHNIVILVVIAFIVMYAVSFLPTIPAPSGAAS